MSIPSSYSSVLDLSTSYAMLREQHQAWRLLAANRAPLILACAEQLFTGKQKSVTLDDAVELLAQSFTAFANDASMNIDKDPYKLARKEWRDWLARGLIVERGGEVLATDALERVLSFVKALKDDGLMTSTASRLATVQERLNHVALHLDPDKERHEAQIEAQIERLKLKLEAVRQGQVEVMTGSTAAESIKEVYQLAMSLRGDFRRVEDSYRKADQRLRERVIRDDYHRGDIVASLLDTHEELLNTPEGQVFQMFNQALQQRSSIDTMRVQIRQILGHPAARHALNNEQANDFRWLTMLLNKEAQQVSRAKERSERDVRGFLQTGMATEQHRVGELLKQILHHAIELDWSMTHIRRQPSMLLPIAVTLDNLPLVTRLAIKEIKEDGSHDLELDILTTTSLDEVEDSFWQAFDGLDRQAWFVQTYELLKQQHTALTLAQIAQLLPPPSRYDFEAITLWLELGVEVGLEEDLDIESKIETETMLLRDDEQRIWQFTLPKVILSVEKLQQVAEHYL